MSESTIDEARSCPIKRSARASVAARVAAAQRLLNDLGFSPGGETGELSLTDKGIPRATFARANVGLVMDTGVVRAMRGNLQIGRAPTAGEHLEAASFFDHSYLGVDAVAFEWSRSGREGCETTDPRGIQLIPLSLTD